MAEVVISRTGIALDGLLLLMTILGAVNIGIYRHIDLNATLLSSGEDLAYLAWVTLGGFVLNSGILMVASFLDGDSARRSWMAIGSSIVAGSLYFTLAVGSSVHLTDLDTLKYNLDTNSYTAYKFLLADYYVLTILYWIDGGLRVMLRLRSGSGKK